MIRYKDNPKLGLKTVKTFRDEIEYRDNCTKIKHLYYVKNVDCFFVEKGWFRVDNGTIIFDHELNQWVLTHKNPNIRRGVISIKNGELEMGSFSPNLLENVGILHRGVEYTLKSLKDVENTVLLEWASKGIYIVSPSSGETRAVNQIRNLVNNQEQPYNIEDNEGLFKLSVVTYDKYQPIIENDIKRFSKLLGNITFGAEFETIRGYIPKHLQFRNGLIVCRDGSLKDPMDGTQGAEFTTIPLTGAKGVQTLKNICRDLTSRTHIDKQCSLHFHIGNVPTDRLSLLSLYKLCLSIQDELFTMFPYYKLNEVEYAGKNKNYCQKLQLLSISKLNSKFSKDDMKMFELLQYNNLFCFLSGGNLPSKKYNRKNKKHPRQHKWERHSRYYWVNLLNTIFSTRNTVEFRLHQPTTNFTKVASWLFICNAIVKFSNKHSFEILKTSKRFSIKDVLNYYSTLGRDGVELSNFLNLYFLNRVKMFKEEANKGDYMGTQDLKTDSTFFLDSRSLNNFFKYH